MLAEQFAADASTYVRYKDVRNLPPAARRTSRLNDGTRLSAAFHRKKPQLQFRSFQITPLNAKLRQVGVMPLSTSAKVLPPVVVGVPSAGPDSVALCHQLRTIDKMRIGKCQGELSAADMAAVEAAVRQVYGL